MYERLAESRRNITAYMCEESSYLFDLLMKCGGQLLAVMQEDNPLTT